MLEPAPGPAGQADRRSRHPVENREDHQLSKQAAGLDSGQVTTWTSWHRWTAISLLACAFLAVAAAWQRARDSSTAAALG